MTLETFTLAATVVMVVAERQSWVAAVSVVVTPSDRTFAVVLELMPLRVVEFVHCLFYCLYFVVIVGSHAYPFGRCGSDFVVSDSSGRVHTRRSGGGFGRSSP